MKKSKVYVAGFLLLVLLMTGCQSGSTEETAELQAELAAVKEELTQTKEALRAAEEALAELSNVSEVDLLNESDVPSIDNQEAKVAAIKSSVEELARVVESAQANQDIGQLLENFAKRQTIDLSYAYFGSIEDEFIVTPTIELPDGYQITQRPVYLEAIDKEIYVAEVYVDAFDERLVQTISKAVYVDGDLIGVVGIDAYLD